MEAIRQCDSVEALVNITTDKCYKNREVKTAYIETDELGGYDPYSSSKACMEILTDSYRNSFFNLDVLGTKHNCLIATARAGNVIGGGDWSDDRIIPDIIRAQLDSSILEIRNPSSIRPWQHVMEPLSGYLLLGYELLQKKKYAASGWNFGPDHTQFYSVKDIVERAITIFDKNLTVEFGSAQPNVHEAGLLMLDSTKALERLSWNSIFNFEETVDLTLLWYKNYNQKKEIQTEQQINHYMSKVL
jgi:CDP-glucose 4,6-dehydratase